MKIAALVMLADYAVVAQGGGLDYYSLYADDYEYYTDALGNKKKKKKNKNKDSVFHLNLNLDFYSKENIFNIKNILGQIIFWT